MNYLAHARNHITRPYALVGTAVPDLLSILDRRCKLRLRHLPESSVGLDAVSAELRAGMRAHFEDDRWFHQTDAFTAVTGEMAVRMRRAPGVGPRLRASFLAHIAMEMLLDAELMRRDPTFLRAYYLALNGIEPGPASACINRWAPRPALRLSLVLRYFRRVRFLASYTEDDGVFFRLGQVARGVGLGELPIGLREVMPALRDLVREQTDALLKQP